jgi:hypothetical protein
MSWKNLRCGLPLLFSLFIAGACTDESPSDVGDDLLPSGDVRTFEVILEPETWLAYDTTFSGYTTAFDAPFRTVANKFGGVVDSNLLLRMAQPPNIINVRNAVGTVVPDSAPQYFAGLLVLRFDTVRSESDVGTRFRAVRTTEEWDFSANWTLRIDTGSVELPWATPGATGGPQVDTATWAAGDSLVLRVDSQTIAQWRDTTNTGRGVVIVSETNGSRVRVASAVFRLSIRPTIRPDTVVILDIAAARSHFIFNPSPPPAGDQLRVGGVTSWRTILGLIPALRNLTFPCPGVANCQVRLDRAHINLAELLLQPASAPPGFIPEDSTVAQVRTLLVAAGVPLQRSPIGFCSPQRAFCASPILKPSFFAQSADTARVAINITDYVLPLVSADVTDANRPASTLTLSAAGEPPTFGFAAFAPGPRLRLLLTATVERPQ